MIPKTKLQWLSGLDSGQCADGGDKDVFVHSSAVEKADLGSLNEGAKISYEIVANRGKESAENLKVVG